MKNRFFFWITSALANVLRVSDWEIVSHYLPPQIPIKPKEGEVITLQQEEFFLQEDWEKRRGHIEAKFSRQFGNQLNHLKAIDYEIKRVYDRGLPTYAVRATIKLLPAENPI